MAYSSIGDWSVQRKLVTVFSAAIVVLMSLIAAAYFTTESILRSSRGVWQSVDVMATQERIYGALVDVFLSQRAYISSGNQFDLDARNQALDRLRVESKSIEQISAVIAPEQQQRSRQLEDAVAGEVALLDEALTVRAGKTITPEKFAQMIIQARTHLDTIRATLASIENTDRGAVARIATNNYRLSVLLYSGLSLASALFVACVGWLLWRIFADLETRDAIEHRLQHANQFLESLIENVPAMIFVKDARDLKFVRFNRAGEQLLGYDRIDLIGKSDRDFFPAEQAEFFVAKDREVLASDSVADIAEEEIDTRLQGRRILHTRKVPVRDSLGNPEYLLGVSLDITEQKAAERQILKLNEELKMHSELLLAANKELESFCYSVSHDLRAPLRAIDGYANILQQDLGSTLDGNGVRLLKSISNNAHHMAELIDDLLEFSRLGRQSFEMSRVDMTAIATEAAAEVLDGRNAPAHCISFQPLIETKGDSRALHRVWLNLFENAVKYSSNTAAPAISAWAESDGAEIVYSVRDNGIGFDMQYHDKLFGVFERLHSSKEYPGTGVGLAIVQRIVARHGGRVWAESKPGEGAIFHFSLPIVA